MEKTKNKAICRPLKKIFKFQFSHKKTYSVLFKQTIILKVKKSWNTTRIYLLLLRINLLIANLFFIFKFYS